MEQITFDSLSKPLFKIDKPIRLIELFAGIGSQAKALERLGVDFEHYRVCEFDKYAIASYNAIHGTDFKTSDVTKIKGSDLGIVDVDRFTYLLTYSFPCQDLSVAGKQKGMSKGNNTRSGLLWEVERLLNETENLPQVLLMENVPQVHSQANLYDFHKWINFLENKGYSNYWQDLNAKNYGVPQNRDRCFMVSILGQYNYEFPKPFPLKLRLKDVLEKDVDEKYYLSDKGIQYLTSQAETRGEDLSKTDELSLINIAHGQCKGSVIPANTMPTLLTDTADAWKVTVLDPRCVQVAQLYPNTDNAQAGRVYDSNGLCCSIDTCQGGNRMPKIFEPLALDEQNGYIRNDGCVGTLTTDGNSPKHNNRVIEKNYRIRKLTPTECFVLMDFDKEDVQKCRDIGMSNSQLYKQAGNSIVVSVLEAIFKQML